MGWREVPPLPVERIELYPEAQPAWVRIFLKSGESYVLTWATPHPDSAALPGGSYLCRIRPGCWEVLWQGKTRFTFNWFARLPDAVEHAFPVTVDEVLCQVVREERGGTGSSGPDGGKMLFPVQPDADALGRSQELRNFVWQIFEHFFAPPTLRDRNVTVEEIEKFAASRPDVKAVLDRVTQAWAEMQRTQKPTMQRFKPLAELLVEQFQFGNETIIHNELAIRDEPDGLSLYHRVSGWKYYDEYGIPIKDIHGVNRRDVYYTSRQRPASQYAITLDWSTKKLMQMAMSASIDPDIVALAEGYWANVDLWVEDIRTHPADWDNVFKHMREQAVFVLLFLGSESMVVLLERFGSAREKAIARILHAGLVLAGRYFLIQFGYGLKQALFEIGHHLYRVKRKPDGTLDPLSREHLNKASALARPIMDEIVALVLTTGALKVAAATAPVLDPPGGPGSILFVPVPSRAGAGKGPGGVAGAGGTSVGGKAPQPDVLVVMSTAERYGSTKESEKPRTPKELEEQLFGKEKPDSPYYFSRRDRTLRIILKDLLAHVNNPKNQQYYKPSGKPPILVEPEQVNMPTLKFLQRPQYEKLYKRFVDLWTQKLNELKQLKDTSRLEEVRRQYDALDDFAKGNLGDKRPDQVEFLLDRREFASNDASFAWWKPFHNLKNEVYVEALKAATRLKGAGLEIERTVERSRLIESKPAEKP